MNDSAVPPEASRPTSVSGARRPSGRRTFLRVLTGLCGSIAVSVLSVPLVGYFFGIRKYGIVWVDLGFVYDFPLNDTRRLDFENPLKQPWDGITALTGVYARYLGKNEKNEDQFQVLSINCAHLGCPVSWFQQSGLFMCPCHGGVYYADGRLASGPPPRGLYHVVWRVKDGHLQIQAPHYPTLQNPLVKSA